MEFEKAIALAVVSSWDELVKANDAQCTVRIEYRDISGASLEWLKVWMVNQNGHWVLVCNYSTRGSHSSQDLRFRFANSYQSATLAQSLDFIMQNQLRFKRRAAGSSMKGMVEISLPNAEERANADIWKKAVTDDLAREKSTPYSKRN
ncbi:MAG TPA: hypothetical protein VK699_11280 [Terriglobales bacterium]|jgi:hypothetical protein|nr:hypothetical protein [Terriglobales bacterium]